MIRVTTIFTVVFSSGLEKDIFWGRNFTEKEFKINYPDYDEIESLESVAEAMQNEVSQEIYETIKDGNLTSMKCGMATVFLKNLDAIEIKIQVFEL